MSPEAPAALVADDEPLLRQSLVRLLHDAWPGLRVVAEARNGREAVDLFELHRPQVCFLDVQMPGMTGVDAARAIGARSRIVFVTAFSDYAVQAFEQGALDYLVKPVEPARLAATVARVQERLRSTAPDDLLQRLEELTARLDHRAGASPLRFIKASLGNVVRMIPVSQVDFLRADAKYTEVAWRDADGCPQTALVRMPLRELVGLLDPAEFVQVHRSYAVNLAQVSQLLRLDNETGLLELHGRSERIPVSRSCLPLFRQM